MRNLKKKLVIMMLSFSMISSGVASFAFAEGDPINATPTPTIEVVATSTPEPTVSPIPSVDVISPSVTPDPNTQEIVTLLLKLADDFNGFGTNVGNVFQGVDSLQSKGIDNLFSGKDTKRVKAMKKKQRSVYISQSNKEISDAIKMFKQLRVKIKSLETSKEVKDVATLVTAWKKLNSSNVEGKKMFDLAALFVKGIKEKGMERFFFGNFLNDSIDTLVSIRGSLNVIKENPSKFFSQMEKALLKVKKYEKGFTSDGISLMNQFSNPSN